MSRPRSRLRSRRPIGWIPATLSDAAPRGFDVNYTVTPGTATVRILAL